MFKFLKNIFVRLLTSIVNAFSHTKCVSLSNKIQPTLFNLQDYVTI